jgi:hypothetical protein
MPKHTAVEILRRWQAMDAALFSYDGLNIARFARRWKVNIKTVRRDLEAFKELGQRMVCRSDDGGRWNWHYDGEVGDRIYPLFNPECPVWDRR